MLAKIVAIAALLVSFQTLAFEAEARGGGGRSPSVGSTASVRAATGSNRASVHVDSYVRKDGTHVKGHYRSAADGNFANNWSTKGNVNPHTGVAGTRVTPPGSHHTGVGGARPMPSGNSYTTAGGTQVTPSGVVIIQHPPRLYGYR
jgi:hypothetical protein